MKKNLIRIENYGRFAIGARLIATSTCFRAYRSRERGGDIERDYLYQSCKDWRTEIASG